MSTQITKEEKVILMKSKLPIWVEAERVEELEKILAAGTGHRFVNIKGHPMINTAEIEGIYTPADYGNVIRIRQGEWQCPYKKWHKKKEECACKAEIERNEEAKRQQEENSKQRTPEEQARITKQLAALTKEMKKDGILKSATSVGKYKLKRSELKKYKKQHGSDYIVPEGAEILENE